jgi:hypothetical protein
VTFALTDAPLLATTIVEGTEESPAFATDHVPSRLIIVEASTTPAVVLITACAPIFPVPDTFSTKLAEFHAAELTANALWVGMVEVLVTLRRGEYESGNPFWVHP